MSFVFIPHNSNRVQFNSRLTMDNVRLPPPTGTSQSALRRLKLYHEDYDRYAKERQKDIDRKAAKMAPLKEFWETGTRQAKADKIVYRAKKRLVLYKETD